MRGVRLAGEASTLDMVAHVVSDSYGVPIEALMARGRTFRVAFARQVAMYVGYKVSGMTMTEVGNYFGREYTTVSHAYNRVKEIMDRDECISKDVTKLIGICRSHTVESTRQLPLVGFDTVEAIVG